MKHDFAGRWKAQPFDDNVKLLLLQMFVKDTRIGVTLGGENSQRPFCDTENAMVYEEIGSRDVNLKFHNHRSRGRDEYGLDVLVEISTDVPFQMHLIKNLTYDMEGGSRIWANVTEV